MKAAAKRGLGATDMKGVRVAIQGVGSVGGGLARLLAADGAVLTLADVNADRAAALAAELRATTAPAESILASDVDLVSPNALGAVLTEESIAALKVKVVPTSGSIPTTSRGCHAAKNSPKPIAIRKAAASPSTVRKISSAASLTFSAGFTARDIILGTAGGGQLGFLFLLFVTLGVLVWSWLNNYGADAFRRTWESLSAKPQ